MSKFEGLPDLPANWLELLHAETVVIQRNMPQDREEAQAKAHQDTLAELKEMQAKCPQIYQFIQISHEAMQTSLRESGLKEDLANRLTGRFTLSTLALLRMLAISVNGQKG